VDLREAGRWKRRLLHAGQVGMLAAVYFAAAKASLLLAIPPGYATAIWPPAGIALAALLVFGDRLWPGIWLGAALANLTVSSLPFVALVIAGGNTLEALCGAALVRRYIADAPPFFDRARNVVMFVAFAAVCSAVAATIGTGALLLDGAVAGENFVDNWGTWWHGDATGIIIVAPLLLTWRLRHGIAWSRAKVLELAGLVASLLAIATLVFGQEHSPLAPSPPTFLILPFIVWAAFRFSKREVTSAIAAVCAIAVWHTIAGRGPFALDPLNLSLILLLAFISTMVVTGLILSAAVTEREGTLERLEHVLHEAREQARTDPLTQLANAAHRGILQRAWTRARHGRAPSRSMIDLDHYKSVNDGFGHEAGDRVLAGVARLLQAHVRAGDMACRLGGEEFALVLPDATLDVAQRRATALRAAIRGLELRHRGRSLGGITASFGIALFPVHASDPGALLLAADRALYEAKAAGRDRVSRLRGLAGRPGLGRGPAARCGVPDARAPRRHATVRGQVHCHDLDLLRVRHAVRSQRQVDRDRRAGGPARPRGVERGVRARAGRARRVRAVRRPLGADLVLPRLLRGDADRADHAADGAGSRQARGRALSRPQGLRKAHLRPLPHRPDARRLPAGRPADAAA
jgi:diguanylate cyclase (GGDEF)-like protein